MRKESHKKNNTYCLILRRKTTKRRAKEIFILVQYNNLTTHLYKLVQYKIKFTSKYTFIMVLCIFSVY